MNKDAAVKLIAVGGLFGFAVWAAASAYALLTKSEKGNSDIPATVPVAIAPPVIPAPAPVPAPPVEVTP